MKPLATFFALLAALSFTTSTNSIPTVEACQYFKAPTPEDESAFFNIFVSIFKKLQTEEPVSARESSIHLTLMQNLANHFTGDAKKHAHTLLAFLRTNPKLSASPTAAASSPSRSSTTASPHIAKQPLPQPEKKAVSPQPPQKKTDQAPDSPRKNPKNPDAQKKEWENHNKKITAAANNEELQATLAHLKRHQKLPQADKALKLWERFKEYQKKKQTDNATKCMQKMQPLEREITDLLDKQSFSDETRNPRIEYLYKTRQSIQRLALEMNSRLGKPQTKPALRSPKTSKPELTREIPAPRPIPMSPHHAKKTARAAIPKLPVARRPKSILKNPSHRPMPSGLSRTSHKTKFTTKDPDVRLVTARFSYDAYWNDYLNNTESCPYRAPRFKKDSKGTWNEDAIVPLRSIIGSPGHTSEGLSFKDAEECHCWIQWAFPTMHMSDYNQYALTSNRAVLNAIEANPELRNALFYALRYFLAFMGLTVKLGSDGINTRADRITFEQASNYKTRMKNIIEHPHNFKRITRIITSLREHGLSNMAIAFCSYLTNTLPESDAHFKKASQSSKHHWINAANGY